MSVNYRKIRMSESRAITASENGVDHNVSSFRTGVIFLDVTACAGTSPTFNLTIEEKDPESGQYFTIATFTQATGVTTERKTINPQFGSIIRYKIVLGGTSPSFTFQLTAELKS